MDEIDRQAEAMYLRDKSLVDAALTPKQIYMLGVLRGRTFGVDEGMKIGKQESANEDRHLSM